MDEALRRIQKLDIGNVVEMQETTGGLPGGGGVNGHSKFFPGTGVVAKRPGKIRVAVEHFAAGKGGGMIEPITIENDGVG